MKVWFERGRSVKIFEMTRQDLTVDEVSTRMSRIVRFGGGGVFEITDAQHSVMLADFVPKHLRKAALMHDVSEIVFGEVPQPVKDIVPEFGQMEEKFQQYLFKIFNIPWSTMLELHSFDKQIGYDEALAIFPDLRRDPGRPCLGIDIPEWSREYAKQEYATAFYTEFCLYG
jgi:uncharacterized protein